MWGPNITGDILKSLIKHVLKSFYWRCYLTTVSGCIQGNRAKTCFNTCSTTPSKCQVHRKVTYSELILWNTSHELRAWGGGTHRPLAWGVWGHQMLKIRKCQAKSLNRPLLFFSTWGPEEANPCFVIFHVRSAEKFQAIRSLRVLWTGRLVSKFPLNLEPIWKDIQTSIIITVRECVPGREYILGLWQTGAAFEQSDLSQYSLRVWRPRRDLSLV